MIFQAWCGERPLTREQAKARAMFPRGLSQPPGAYRFGLEALLLACLSKAPPGALALDMGTGCGAAGLALALRCQGLGVVGLERLPELCRAAADNAGRLGLRPGPSRPSELSPELALGPAELPPDLPPELALGPAADESLRAAPKIHANFRPESFFSALCGDLAAPPLAQGLFDLALANPPFRRGNRGRLPKERLRRAALFEDGDSLGCFCRAASFCLKTGGRLAIIYDAERGDELLTALESQGLIPLRLKPVVTRKGRPPLRLLVEALRPGAPGPGCEAEQGAGAASGPDRNQGPERGPAAGSQADPASDPLDPLDRGQGPKPGPAAVSSCPPPIMEKALVLHRGEAKAFSAEALAFCPFLEDRDLV